MNTLAIAIATTITIGAGAGFFAFELYDSEAPAADACRTWPLEERTGDGLIRFRITNEGPAINVTTCVITYGHEKVALRNVTLPAYETTSVDFDVPVGMHWIQVESRGTQGGSSANLWLCVHRAHQQPFRVHESPNGSGGGVSSGNCFDPASSKAASQQQGVIPFDELQGPAGPALGIGLGTAGLTGLAFVFRVRLHFLGLLLFTRLTKPKVLDLDARARIHELVTQEPGIHASAIGERLELASGETTYHLHVLTRERLLVRIGNWGQRSFFVAGRYGPRQMRAMAALRSRALGRLYEAVQRAPGATLPNVARAAGYSLGRASRLSRRLEEVGLVQRTSKGRAIILTPGAPSEPITIQRAV